MKLTKDRILSDENPFIVRETDLRILKSHPLRLHGGAIMLCKSGTATISIDMTSHEIGPDSQITVMPDSVVKIERADDDFRTILFYFTRQIFEEGHRQFTSSFFQHLVSYPVYYHSPFTANLSRQIFSLIMAVYSDMSNRYRTTIITHYLRIILLNIYDKVQRKVVRTNAEEYTRKEELCHRFFEMVLENCIQHRDVEFYADKLCISKRYLALITRETIGETPKSIIDKHLIHEIKAMLTFSGMPIQQIVDYLHFPDQSYLGRFFKRHTGQSPAEYRSVIDLIG